MRRFRAYFVALLGVLALAAAACTPPTTGGSNVAPTAVAAADPTSGQAPLLVQFSSQGSNDSDGFIEEIKWDFGDGSPTTTAPNPVHTYVAGGNFTATLTVTDDGGATATSSQLIHVDPPDNYPPTAIIGANATTGKSPLVITFDSSSSTDVDGTITSRSWNFGDASPLDTATAPSHTYSVVGTYVASLTVTDNTGATNTDTLNVTVVANQPPTAAAAGTPTSGKVPVTVAFSSNGTDDADGTVTALDWNFGDGSAHSSDASPIHTYTAAGVYTATLTATDDNGDTDTATVAITVLANQAPTAVANATPDAGKAPLGVILSSAGSADSDGSIVSYDWDFGDGSPHSNAANISHLYTAQGTYSAVLTVVDDDGASATSTVVVNVAAPNVAPTVVATANPAFGKSPLAVSFSSAGTADSDGTIASYQWNFGDTAPASSTSANPSHTYNTPGTYTATLTVTDNDGATTTQPVTINVLANVAPTASASASPLSGKEPLQVAFNSAASIDPDGTIVSYAWDFGDTAPASSTSANPSHTYNTPGTYTATLTVTDDNGASDTTSVNIVVNPNQSPTAVANATSATTGNAPLTVSFDGAASSDPDGTFTYSWNFGDGSAADTSAAPSHAFANVGDYTVTLTVTDDNGATSTATVTVHAEDLVLRVRNGGNDAGTGQVNDPMATIDGALTAAVARGKVEIHVAGGAYGGFAVVDGIDVIGGYDQSFALGGGDGATEAVVTGAAGSAGVTANAQATPTILKGLTIHGGGGANATGVLATNGSMLTLDTVKVDSGATSGAGSSAYGVRSLSGSHVTVLGSEVTAQEGAQGASGTSGSNGAGGPNGLASTGNPLVGVAPGGVSAGGTGLARSGKGADGAQNLLQTVDGKTGEKGGSVAGDGGGAGGAAGNVSAWGGRGGGGGTSNGAAGAAGAAGTTAFGAIADLFQGTGAGIGGVGGVGAGGGGGGSGRAASTRSGAGGSGGAGGLGGAGGTGGATGGASIAVFAHDADLTVDNTVLTTGAGGVGGTGGAGGIGGKGGNGGAGMNVTVVGGGGGGGGAAGGRGGSGGGGGTGGPAIAAFHGGTGTLSVTNRTGTNGAGGVGGTGGAGGAGGVGGTGGPFGTGDTLRNGTAGGAGALGQLGSDGSAGLSGVTFNSWDNGVSS